jgi:hypothetical protein
MEKKDQLKERLIEKRILLLSVEYFDYENAIARQIRSYGATVDFYDERPSNTILAKGIIRLKSSLYQKAIDNYYHKILKQISSLQYDYLLVIRGEVVPAFFLEEFKRVQPECRLLFYTWDSFKNNKHPLSILKYFDDCYTFDPHDAWQYHLKFRPLFFIDHFAELKNGKRSYHLLFLGTAHSDRYLLSRKIIEWCHSKGLHTFAYYYCRSRWVYLYKRLFDPTFKKTVFKKLSFQNLNINEIFDLYSKSQVILDIHHPHQTGLTIRTLEALGAGKKVITTNPEILNYSFYNEKNVLIIDRLNPNLNLSFFTTPFVPLDTDLLFTMSLSGWLSTLFLETETYGLLSSHALPIYRNAGL